MQVCRCAGVQVCIMRVYIPHPGGEASAARPPGSGDIGERVIRARTDAVDGERKRTQRRIKGQEAPGGPKEGLGRGYGRLSAYI